MHDTMTPLFVPADRPERYIKAAASGTDAIIIDLEDAVAPASKAQARRALAAPAALPRGIDIYIRVNAVNTPWYQDDLAAIATMPVTGIMLAKAESARDANQASAASAGKPVIALLETALGLAMAREIAAADSVRRLAFGSIDYCADLGASHVRDALLAARNEIVLASRLASLPSPLDGVTTALDDEVALEEDARYAQALGFGGKLCIHPRQIIPVRRGFAPTARELDWARRIVAAGERGAANVDGAMVDAPVRARAKQIIDRARYKNAISEEETK